MKKDKKVELIIGVILLFIEFVFLSTILSGVIPVKDQPTLRSVSLVTCLVIDVLFVVGIILYNLATPDEFTSEHMIKLRKVELIIAGVMLLAEVVFGFIMMFTDGQGALNIDSYMSALLAIFMFINIFYLLVVLIINTTCEKKIK